MDQKSVPIVDLRREEIERAKAMTVEQKLAAGGDLFDYACDISNAGIRFQNPGISDADVLIELRRRLALGRKLEARRAAEKWDDNVK